MDKFTRSLQETITEKEDIPACKKCSSWKLELNYLSSHTNMILIRCEDCGTAWYPSQKELEDIADVHRTRRE